MNRLRALVAVVVASVTSIACAAPTDEDREEDVAQVEDGLTAQQALSCHRFPTDSCVTLERICRKRGGQLWCDLQGNCTCRLPILQASPAFTP